MGHGKGLAGTGHAQQGLEGEAIPYPFHQLFDGFGLVAGRLEHLMQFVRTIGEGNDHGYNSRAPFFDKFSGLNFITRAWSA